MILSRQSQLQRARPRARAKCSQRNDVGCNQTNDDPDRDRKIKDLNTSIRMINAHIDVILDEIEKIKKQHAKNKPDCMT